MTEAFDSIEIRPLRAAEIESIGALARLIWRAHYPGIIGAAQIEYMLAQRYSTEVMHAEIERDDLWWLVLHEDGEARAFASFFLTGEPGEMKLDKLYVHPEHQRRGLGARLIDRTCAIARERGCRRLLLAVNRNNVKAIAAYRKHGFEVERTVVKDIGEGFVMDDFLTVRPL